MFTIKITVVFPVISQNLDSKTIWFFKSFPENEKLQGEDTENQIIGRLIGYDF